MYNTSTKRVIGMKEKYYVFDYVLLFMPVIDVLTSISIRCFNLPITLGAVFKTLMLLYFVIYTLFITNSKSKLFVKKYFLLILLFILGYFCFKPELLHSNFFLLEISYLFKFIFFSIMFGALLCYYGDNEFRGKKLKNILLSNLIYYATFLIIPFITRTAFNTYIDGSYGYVGWFYSGNELSAILILIFPFLYTLVKNYRILSIILSIPIIFGISQIGTKVSLIGMFILTIIIIIVAFLNRKKLTFKSLLTILVITISTILIMYNGQSLYNVNTTINNATENFYNSELNNMIGSDDDNLYYDKWKAISIALLSERNIFLKSTHKIWSDNLSVKSVLFGLGFSDTEKINDFKINKMIEIDILDIFYHYGIFGIIIFVVPWIFVAIKLFVYIRNNQFRFSGYILFYFLMLLMLIGVSCISGHVFLNPAVSLYVVLYLMLLLGEIDMFKNKNLTEKKVSILSLHLGYGGAERATVDLANMLCEKYEVELVSLYKTVDQCPFDVDNRVKIIYLTDIRPNKKEFLQFIKNKNFISAFFEGIKALRILFLKYKKMRNYIISSESKFIISSRFYFTKLLNRFGRSDCIKIAIEHNYDVGKKYILKTKKHTNNINKLVLVSKSALKEYKKYINQVVYIPNVISTLGNSVSDLNNKNLISVGRLEPEKGFDDLIKVMRSLVDYDSEYHLNIFGDGSEKENLVTLICRLHLDDHVTMHGFQPMNVISKYYMDSSLYIMTSHKESFGIVLLESMSFGVPALAFDSAVGACDIINNNVNGFLIANRDHQEMVSQIVKYTNLKTKKHVQKKCLETTQEFNMNKISQSWYELLKEATKNKL